MIRKLHGTTDPRHLVATFLLDANLFIGLSAAQRGPYVPGVAAALACHGDRGALTPLVLGEIGTLTHDDRSKVADLARKHLQVIDIPERMIDALEQRAGGTTSAPQRTDLSLLVAAGQVQQQGQKAVVVSDDFKIYQTAQRLQLGVEVISPSAFLLQLSNTVSDPTERKLFRRLYRSLRRHEVSYLLSRRDLYDPEPKLDWLIDNLLAVSPSTAAPARTPMASVTTGDAHDESWEEVLRHLRGERVRPAKLRPFEPLLPHLQPILEYEHAHAQVLAVAREGDAQEALRMLRTALARLQTRLHLGVTQLPPEHGLQLRRVYAHVLCHGHLLVALLALSVDEGTEAMARLQAAAAAALETGDSHTVVLAHYLQGMGALAEQDLDGATTALEATVDLAVIHQERTLALMARLALAIVTYHHNQPKAAASAMEDAQRALASAGANATEALLGLGDHLFHIGRLAEALLVFDEGLEVALTWHQDAQLAQLRQRVTVCHTALGVEAYHLDEGLREFIDHANRLEEGVAQAYNEELHAINTAAQSYSVPLPRSWPAWTLGADLSEVAGGWHEVLRLIPLDGSGLPLPPSPEGTAAPQQGTLLVCYLPSLGPIAFYHPSVLVPSVTEHLFVRLDPQSRFRLLDAPTACRERFGVRGLLGGHEGGGLQLRRGVHALLEEGAADDLRPPSRPQRSDASLSG